MKKIIKNKVYNTETAIPKGNWESSCYWSDYRWYMEQLYQKKTGEFFLYGEGHEASPYAKKEFDGWTHGEKIIPLTYKEAQKWAEEKLDADDYEAIFGEVTEVEELAHIHISLPADQAKIIRKNAQQEGLTISAYIAKKCTE